MEVIIVPAVVVPTFLAWRAGQCGHGSAAIVGLVLLQLAGLAILGVGLVVLAFDGHVEDYGFEPVRTWPIALPVLLTGAAATGAAWRLDGRPPRR